MKTILYVLIFSNHYNSQKEDGQNLEGELDAKADEKFEHWMENNQMSNEYLFDNAKKLPEGPGPQLKIE